MTHSYKVKGMTCKNCLSTVKSALENIKGIEKAEVTLDPPAAEITMSVHVPESILNNELAKHGNYSIEEIDNAEIHNVVGENQYEDRAGGKKSFLQTYKPILLVFAYLFGIALFSQLNKISFSAEDFMRIFMGGFFLVFSFFKLLDLKGFAYSYMSYDIIAKRWIGWGYIYPFIELALGFAYMFHFDHTITNTVTFIVMGVSTVGVASAVLAKRKFQCACLGTVFNLPMSTITLTEDLLMVLMAGAMLII